MVTEELAAVETAQVVKAKGAAAAAAMARARAAGWLAVTAEKAVAEKAAAARVLRMWLR